MMNITIPVGSFLCSLLVAAAATPVRAAEVPEKAYLFSYFINNGEDGLHLAWSADGLKWQALNDGKSFLKPEVGKSKLMRDPCVTTGPDGTFHMVWTDSWDSGTIGYASSKDLITWSPQKDLAVMAHEPGTRNCWAPEIVYDAMAKHFRIVWASTIPGKFPETDLGGRNDLNHRMYSTTTTDFETFTPTTLYFDPGHNVIDSTLTEFRGKTVMVYKDETKVPEPKKNLKFAIAPSPAGPFTPVPGNITPPGSWVEGPTVLHVGDDTILYFDAYTRHRYEALATKDFKVWRDVSDELTVPAGIRHGTAFAVPGAVVKRLLAPKPGYTIFPNQPKQTIWGLGFEIQCDSIGSGNNGLPEKPIAVPHDLVPSERQRLADEMLKGFRYCRLAGGLYWRGLDAAKKQLLPRWSEQLTELKALLDRAGVEGLSFEYWSPPPFWKASQSYIGAGEKDPLNQLRCFAPGFENDPIYKGDADRFLADFSQAVVADIQMLKNAGFKISMWGLQNEPFISNNIYPTCIYPESANYLKAYRAVASAVRKSDPNILLFADTEESFPKKIAPGMKDPEIAALVDAYVVHTIGTPSEHVREVHEKIRKELPQRPWFQNEYEYLSGPTSPDRCLNTVQHIMNSFQLAENPTWFWIHALKPFKNSEASGYSLGFWKSLVAPDQPEAPASNAPAIQPGHWIYNPYNWNAVGSFVKHMPWDSVAVEFKEETYDANGRIFAFKRPDGKLTIVVSNRRNDGSRSFHIATGLENATWKGYRYTPEQAGENTIGVSIGGQSGAVLNAELPPQSWEFWVQQ